MHRVNALSFEGLVMIDLIFHLTLIVVAMILTAFFLRVHPLRPDRESGLALPS
jgi:hypothetical protein